MAGAKIPQDWDGETWICWSVEWPDSRDWLAILSGFITTPRKGRYWDADTGDLAEVQATGDQIWFRNTPLEESIMSCNEDTLAELVGIRAALEALVNKPCCPDSGTTGSRGSGSTDSPPNPYDQSEAEGEPPTGFPSYGSYTANKCNKADDVITQLASDLLGLSGLTYAGSVPTGIVGLLITTLLTPIPYDELIALAGYLIFTGYNYALLAEMSAKINENRDDLRCLLYTSDSATSAQAALQAALQTIAEDYYTNPDDAEWVVGAVDYMLSYDSINRMFENVPGVATDTDCSDCGGVGAFFLPNPDFPAFEPTIISGSYESGDVTLQSAYGNFGLGAEVNVILLQSDNFNLNRTMEIVDMIDPGNGQANINWWLGSTPQTDDVRDWPDIPLWNTAYGTGGLASNWAIWATDTGNNPFTIRFRFHGESS